MASGLTPGEDLVVARAGSWRLLVPMRHVERVHEASLPSAVPSGGDPSSPMMALGEELVPVVFCDALFGAAEVHVGAEDKMMLLSEDGRRVFLWVSAAEEVVAYEPVAEGRTPLDLAAGFSGRDLPLAVLDVPGLLHRACRPAAAGASQGASA